MSWRGPVLVARWAVQGLTFTGTRSLLVVIAIAVATCLVAMTIGFLSGYEAALEHNIDALGFQVLVTGKGCPHEAATLMLRGGSIPMYIRDQVYHHIVTQPEVEEATRFLLQAVTGEQGRSSRLYMGVDEAFLRLKPGLEFQRGQWFSAEDAHEVILGSKVAEALRLNLGDGLEVRGQRLQVQGVFHDQGTQDDGTVFLPLHRAQVLFELGDRVTGIGLRLKDIKQSGALMERIYDVPSVQVVRMSQVHSMIVNVLHSIRSLLLSLVVLSATVAALSIVSAGVLAATERQQEMGVLRAMGASSPLLFSLSWSESVLISVLGAGAGSLLALAVRGAMEGALRASLSFVPAGHFIVLTPRVLGLCSGLVILLCVLAAVYPAWKATRLLPMDTLRGGAG